MLHALVFAAEAAEEQGSHTAFYVAGLLLVVWALAVSVAGIARAQSFPSRTGARSGIIGVTALLVLGTLATAILTS